MRRNADSKNAWSFLVGLGVGAAVSLLLVRKSGDEMRECLADGVRAGRNAAAMKAQKWVRRAEKAALPVRDSAARVAEQIEDALPE